MNTTSPKSVLSQSTPVSPGITMTSSNSANLRIPMKNDADSICKRVVMILAAYYKFTKNSTSDMLANMDWGDIFGAHNKYTAEWLVNDFNYILECNDDDEDIEKLHIKLTQCLDWDEASILSDFQEGSILHRHLICDKWKYNSKQSIVDLYFGAKNQNDWIQYKLLDKMFVHIMYPHLLGLRLTSNELNAIQVAAASERKDDDDETEQDLDLELSKLNEVLTERRVIWNKLKSSEWMKKYNDSKFVTYLVKAAQINEESKTESEEASKSQNSTQEQQDNANANGAEQVRARGRSLVNDYSIGERYYYDQWNYYSENHEKLKISLKHIIRGSHFANLKDEMMQSSAMGMDEWILLERFCQLLFASNKCRSLKCDILKSDGHGIDIHYGLKQGDNILLQHIQSIYIYCNFPDIKRKLHRHLKDNKYAHFGRLLRETVEGFGISVFHDDAEPHFYHNVCVKSSSSSSQQSLNDSNAYFNGYLALKFCKPSLMTPYKHILHLYNMENKYVTLTLTKYTNSSSVNYFDCSWISDASLDKECLFIGGKYAMKLDSIIVNNVYNYSHYLSAIHVLSALIKGKANTIPITKSILYAIETLTKNKLQFTQNERTMSVAEESNNEYIMNIFDRFCANITVPIYINLIWVLDASSNGYDAIKQWITNDDHSWIRFDVLCSLFPNVERMKIGHSQFNLQKSTFDTFIDFFGAQHNEQKEKPETQDGEQLPRHSLQEIVIEDPNESDVSVKSIVNAYAPKLNAIGWKMESNKFYTKIYLVKKTGNLWDDLF